MQTFDEAVFWRKVRFDDGCWIWTGPLNHKGYGRSWHDGAMRFAHRRAYEYAFGVDPGDLCVCHKCDVRNCVNPSHLFLGTHADNVRDRDAKGRTRDSKGAANTAAKLTDADVLRIRQMRADGALLREIVAEFPVSKTMVCNIAKRRNWSHL